MYPSEHVVRFLAGLPERGYSRLLDIGCGHGRHLRCARTMGFQVDGVDVSEVALHEDVPAIAGSMLALPFPADAFDVALAFGVFYYGTMGQADHAVHEMHRVLRPGGHGFVSVRSCRDWRADHTDYHGVFHCEGEPEDGMQLDFISEDELHEVYGVFRTVEFEIAEWTTHDRDRRNSDWLITVQR